MTWVCPANICHIPKSFTKSWANFDRTSVFVSGYYLHELIHTSGHAYDHTYNAYNYHIQSIRLIGCRRVYFINADSEEHFIRSITEEIPAFPILNLGAFHCIWLRHLNWKMWSDFISDFCFTFEMTIGAWKAFGFSILPLLWRDGFHFTL